MCYMRQLKMKTILILYENTISTNNLEQLNIKKSTNYKILPQTFTNLNISVNI